MKVSEPVALPRLPSLDTDNVPWLMAQPVATLVVPLKVQVPLPVFR